MNPNNSKEAESPAGKNKSKKEMSEESKKVMECLKNPLDFEILMYFIIFRELTLAQLQELILHKSRPTIYRHIQNLLEVNLIVEAREEKVRSPIKTKIYQVSPSGLQAIPHFTPEQIVQMTPKEKSQLYETIREALYPTLNFMGNMLNRMVQYLQLLKPYPEKELVETFERQDFHLNLNFFSEKQYQLFISEFQEFMRAFIPKMIEEEQKNPNAERTYAYLIGILPIRSIFDRIMEEKSSSQ